MITEAMQVVHRLLCGLENRMDRGLTMTPISVRFRRRAADFARTADALHTEGKGDEAMRCVQTALSWIHLAENEELLGGAIAAVKQ